MQDIIFHCGIAGEKKWNHHPVATGSHACVAPVIGNKKRRTNSCEVPAGTKVIQDSGAFSDNWHTRLTVEDALARQIKHASRYGYTSMITHRASYDLLIDEKWIDGVRKKVRWTEAEAWKAVDTTVAAADYLSRNRNNLGLILSAQGVTASQYLECVKRVIPFMDVERDMLGLGGWCITGKFPGKFLPVFRETMRKVIPYASKQGVKIVHVWGVLYAPALAELVYQSDLVGIQVSTDNSGPSIRPVRGQWGYDYWADPYYIQPPVEVRGLQRAAHVQAVRNWLAEFRNCSHYQELVQPTKIKQLPLFGVAA